MTLIKAHNLAQILSVADLLRTPTKIHLAARKVALAVGLPINLGPVNKGNRS